MTGLENRTSSNGQHRLRHVAASSALALLFFLALLPVEARSQEPESPAPTSTAPVVPAPDAPPPLKLADFRDSMPSPEVRDLAHWAVHSRDHGHFPFMVVDKLQARVWVFDNTGVLRGATTALLGTAVGDDSVPGIGQRKLSSIRPHERTTPAGRFMAYLDKDIHGEEVLWVDYDTAFSLHRMPKGHPSERRAERMASPTPADNRITYGCINVSVSFYETVVSPLLRKTQGVVYVLPETRPAQVVFGSYPVLQAAASVPAPPAVPPLSISPWLAEPTRTVFGRDAALTR